MAVVWCCSVFLTLASTNHITRFLKLQILKKCLSHYDVERHPKKERLTWIHRKEVLDRLSFRMCMFRYGCQPIKLQDSFVRNISWIGDWIILIFFLHEGNYQGKETKNSLFNEMTKHCSQPVRLQGSLFSIIPWIKPLVPGVY